MSSPSRSSFDPKKARGAIGASLFDSLSPQPEKDHEGCETPDPASTSTNANRDTESKTDHPLTVSQVAEQISKVLLDHLPRKIRVVGEISNLSTRDHWYFSMKDEKTVLSCVAWASKARSFGFDAKNGLAVVATGSIQFYAPQGRCQFYVDRLEPIGAGALELRFRALCDELRGKGYFNPERKKTPPAFPRRVAVVTSERGAALQDVLDTMKRRCPAVDVLLVDVRVQGEGAAGVIAHALGRVAHSYEHLGIDALIMTRGGGSIEDLWAFNERRVADALLDFPIPTIAAIGHETDTTIAELVADVRCATPTQAAMVVTPDRTELNTQLDHACRRITQFVAQRLRINRDRLRFVEMHLLKPEELLTTTQKNLSSMLRELRHVSRRIFDHSREQLSRAHVALQRNRPMELTVNRARRLELASFRLARATGDNLRRDEVHLQQLRVNSMQHMKNELVRNAARLARAEAVLCSINPRHVVSRGYSITRRADDGRIVRSITDVRKGEMVQTEFGDGLISSTVDDIIQKDSDDQTLPMTAHDLPTSRVPRSSSSKGQPDEPNLF